MLIEIKKAVIKALMSLFLYLGNIIYFRGWLQYCYVYGMMNS